MPRIGRSALFPADRGGNSAGRFIEGEAEARLGAANDVRGAGARNDARGSRIGQARRAHQAAWFPLFRASRVTGATSHRKLIEVSEPPAARSFHRSNSAASVKARSPRSGGCGPLAYFRPRLSEYQPT